MLAEFIDPAVLGFILIGVMLFSIFIGFPISFTLIFLGFVFGYLGFGKLVFYLMTLQFSMVMTEQTLAAVPLFVFMGIMMEQAGLMERLFSAFQLILAKVRGSLYYAVLFVSVVFAAATGIVGASVTILGIMAAKSMNKSGYDVRLAAGTITAGGTLGILIPPSIMLVVMGPIMEIPVTDLFAAAIIPGILLAVLYAAYTTIRCWINPSLGPALPPELRATSLKAVWIEFFLGLVPPAALVFAALGSILFGFATPTEAAGCGALGSLYYAVLFVSVVFAAATGIVGASVTILGIMAAKSMNKSGYDVRLAAGTITAGGTLGILIPPSIMLVVMGPIMEIPVTDLFAAAIIPGILLAVLYAAYTTIRCWINPSLGPALPPELRATSLKAVWIEFFLGLVPPAALVFAALGSILFGFATPTEAAGCGALGSLLLALAYKKLTFKKLQDSLVKTLEISALIMVLVAASNFFGAVFSRLGTPMLLTDFLLGLEMNKYLILALVMVMIFLLGWPLEWVPIVMIIVPIILPLIEALGFNLTWFAILVAVNLQTAWLSPPVALSAYFLKGVVPEWDLKDIYYGMMQFMVIQVIGLVLIIIFPQIALWLPAYLYGQ